MNSTDLATARSLYSTTHSKTLALAAAGHPAAVNIMVTKLIAVDLQISNLGRCFSGLRMAMGMERNMAEKVPGFTYATHAAR